MRKSIYLNIKFSVKYEQKTSEFKESNIKPIMKQFVVFIFVSLYNNINNSKHEAVITIIDELHTLLLFSDDRPALPEQTYSKQCITGWELGLNNWWGLLFKLGRHTFDIQQPLKRLRLLNLSTALVSHCLRMESVAETWRKMHSNSFINILNHTHFRQNNTICCLHLFLLLLDEIYLMCTKFC